MGQAVGAPYAPQLGIGSVEISTALAAQRSGSAAAARVQPAAARPHGRRIKTKSKKRRRKISIKDRPLAQRPAPQQRARAEHSPYAQALPPSVSRQQQMDPWRHDRHACSRAGPAARRSRAAGTGEPAPAAPRRYRPPACPRAAAVFSEKKSCFAASFSLR